MTGNAAPLVIEVEMATKGPHQHLRELMRYIATKAQEGWSPDTTSWVWVAGAVQAGMPAGLAECYRGLAVAAYMDHLRRLCADLLRSLLYMMVKLHVQLHAA